MYTKTGVELATPRRRPVNITFLGSEIRNYEDLSSTPVALKTYSGYKICNYRVQFQMEIGKISRRRSRSSDDAELGGFTFFFGKEMYKYLKLTAQLLFFALTLLLGGVLVAV